MRTPLMIAIVVLVVFSIVVVAITSYTTVSMYDELTETQQQTNPELTDSKPVESQSMESTESETIIPQETDILIDNIKEQAVKYSYNDLVRNTADYKDKIICVDGQASVFRSSGTWSIHDNFGSYSSAKLVTVDSTMEKNAPKVINNDIVEVCGVVDSLDIANRPLIWAMQTTILKEAP
ncbi:MAG: hypothetical protein OXC46_04550 [Thaumarchaeota archaeon]|nr:hypothetical protein [Nitrososphaerota archaeon]